MGYTLTRRITPGFADSSRFPSSKKLSIDSSATKFFARLEQMEAAR